jgi:hypothetical protein
MTTVYYIEDNNNSKILLFNIDRKTLRDNIKNFYPQYQGYEILETEDNIVIYNNEYVFESDIEDIKKADRKKTFKKEFFNTSLGWIRRTVTKADGSHADFLLNYVPALKTALEMGLSYEILTYDMPSFDTDIIDWTPYQHFKPINAEFIR